MTRLIISLILSLAALSAADVTISVSSAVKPLPLSTTDAATSPRDLFWRSCPEEVSGDLPYTPELLLSSYDDEAGNFSDHVLFPSSDGFIRGAIEAWAQHQSILLRPDEVWFEILAQLNYYMTAHANDSDVRSLFVNSTSGKEEIRIEGLTWRAIIGGFADAIQKRVKTDWLEDWVLPGFSTTTANDNLTATVLLMGLMQDYFSFSGVITCGIPSVTLLGERADWARLLAKLPHLEDFGEEPKAFARNLLPILTRFVATFDQPNSKKVKSFWSQIVRANKVFSCGRGPTEYDISGWITGFMQWTPRGDLRVREGDAVPSDKTVTLDGVVYMPQALTDIQIAYAKAPLKMVDYPRPGIDTMSYLLAGNVGVERRTGSNGKVTALPRSGWFMYAPVDTNYTIESKFGSYQELEDIAQGLSTCKL